MLKVKTIQHIENIFFMYNLEKMLKFRFITLSSVLSGYIMLRAMHDDTMSYYICIIWLVNPGPCLQIAIYTLNYEMIHICRRSTDNHHKPI